LAGTVGAVCSPFMIGIWRRYPWTARMGLAACLVMIFTSASSGPVMSAAAAAFALALWHWRQYTRRLRIAALCAYVLLEIVMRAPAYYLLARIDIAGGSTGYHRAALIKSSLAHMNEWWFAGTDYTRHWMETGVSWSEDHADITNYYIKMGVIGGLPLMLLLIAALGTGFYCVGRAVKDKNRSSSKETFAVWCVGASLFAHAATCVSVSYFDQSYVFFYTTLGIAGSLGWSSVPRVAVAAKEDARNSRFPGPGVPVEQTPLWQ